MFALFPNRLLLWLGDVAPGFWDRPVGCFDEHLLGYDLLGSELHGFDKNLLGILAWQADGLFPHPLEEPLFVLVEVCVFIQFFRRG